ncbi:MAG: hypothetical protein PHS53_02465 [Candidatus Pacebacteria bacterium]|nr:hypothetical protein [Candidatus Paceibacterota bacterium]MDD5356987.1 hypothetical protein [Candidatus Paceibacterota bacterium]
MNQKNLIASIIIFVALLLGGFGGYYLSHRGAVSPTPEPTGGTDADTIEGNTLPSANDAKYLTYENKQYGFSLLYPAVLARTSGSGALVSFTDSNNIEIRILKIADSDADYENTLIASTYYDGSGANPKSFSEFKPVTIGENTFYFIKTGLFEGVLSLHYYAVRKTGIYDFSLVSRGVDWTNPNFSVEEEQGHLYLKQILSSIVFGGSVSAITPLPTKPALLTEYRSDESGYIVEYPQDFRVDESGKSPVTGDFIQGIIFHFPTSLTSGTNLSQDSYISIETKGEVACTPEDFLGDPLLKQLPDINSGSIAWKGGMVGDAGAGNMYVQNAYATLHNTVCYGVRLFLHSTNVDNYPSGTIRAFDRSLIDALYQQMIASFRWTQ